MQGHPEVVDYLKDLLRGELAVRDQYFAHSRIYEDQGFTKLFTRLDHEMQEESQHADALLRHILMLGGRPDMRPKEFTPGETVPEDDATVDDDLGDLPAVSTDKVWLNIPTRRPGDGEHADALAIRYAVDSRAGALQFARDLLGRLEPGEVASPELVAALIPPGVDAVAQRLSGEVHQLVAPADIPTTS